MKTPFSTEPNRLEAFSDGVMAVIITIMVLELKAPHGPELHSLRETVPTLLTYVLSFVYVGIYWNNHHHLLRAVRRIDGRAMWFNLLLLFCLSLVPFTTSWLGEYPSSPVPTALYGAVLLCDAIAFTLLQFALIACNGRDTPLAKAIAKDVKGKASIVLYVAGIGFAFASTVISDALFVTVALLWFVPDRRMEDAIVAAREGRALDPGTAGR